MIGIVVECTEVSNFQQQWEYALSHFQVDALYALGDLEMEGAVLANAILIEDVSELPQDHSLVVLAPQNGLNVQGDKNLTTFIHPLDVIYFFGSDSHHLEAEVFANRVPDHKVYVPTDTDDQMYSFAAWIAVAWDRHYKSL